jgi:FAD/FMN-containing dehydrogenase
MHQLSGMQINHADSTATVGAGVTIHQLGQFLHDNGCALPTMGDTDRQSVVGAAATDTHGSGKTLHGLGEYVTAMKIVTADGVAHDVTDEDELRAARVSVGRLGAIHSLTIRILPRQLWLQHRRDTITGIHEDFEPDAIAERLEENLFLEYLYFPYTDYGDRIKRVEIEAQDEIRDYFEEDEKTLQNALRLEKTALEDPRRLPGLLRSGSFFRDIFKGREKRKNPAHLILPLVSQTTVDHLKTHTMEYLVPLDGLASGFGELKASIEAAEARDIFISAPVHIRFVAKGTSHLSPYQWDVTASFSVNFSRGYPGAHVWFQDFEGRMRDLGGVPHLGKISYHPTVFPPAFEAVRSQFDPGGVFDNPQIQYPTPESNSPL